MSIIIKPKENNSLVLEYRSLCKKILNAFLKKHDATFEWWLNDEVGTSAEIGGHLIAFSDIIIDLEEDAHKDCIWEYYTSLSATFDQYVYYSDYIKHYSKK